MTTVYIQIRNFKRCPSLLSLNKRGQLLWMTRFVIIDDQDADTQSDDEEDSTDDEEGQDENDDDDDDE